MIFQQIPSGGDRNFGYLVACPVTKQAAVVDPSPDPVPASEKAEQLGLTVAYVINTHSHHDHTAGNRHFIERHGARLIAHQLVSDCDIPVDRGKTLALGEQSLEFFHTPGHTTDSICIRVGRELMTGDTLFVGKVGGTYSHSDARMEFESLKRLMLLEDDNRVWPGHDYGVRPTSTIGEERRSNPFILRLGDFKEFVWLKENWLDYKREHHIQ